MKKNLFFLLVIISINSIHAQIISEERRITWNPGIAGGIPEVTAPVLNINDFGADPEGIKDSYHAFVLAIQSLPESGGIVSVPEGTYKIESEIIITKTNVLLRGTGINSKLVMANNGTSISVLSDDSIITLEKLSPQRKKELRNFALENLTKKSFKKQYRTVLQ